MNKKAQVGDTVSWMVATIVIVVILLIGITIAGGADIVKNVFGSKDSSYLRISDNFAGNSFYSFLDTDFSGKKAYELIKESEELSDEEVGNFAVKVFEGIYEKEELPEYNRVWMGVYEGRGIPQNDFFGNRPIESRSSDLRIDMANWIIYEFYLSQAEFKFYPHENKSFDLLLEDENYE